MYVKANTVVCVYVFVRIEFSFWKWDQSGYVTQSLLKTVLYTVQSLIQDIWIRYEISTQNI